MEFYLCSCVAVVSHHSEFFIEEIMNNWWPLHAIWYKFFTALLVTNALCYAVAIAGNFQGHFCGFYS